MPKHTSIKLNDADLQNLIAEYKSGISPTILAKKYGYAFSTSITGIMDSLGVPKQVPRVSDEERLKMKELRETGLSTTEIGKILFNHGFYVRDECTVRRNLKKMGCKILPPGETRLFSIKENYFHSINSEHNSYYLGLLFADGCIKEIGSSHYKNGNKKNCYEVKISLQEEDVKSVISFSKEIYSIEKISSEKRILPSGKNREYFACHIYSKIMVQDLISHGCTQKKSLTLNFPTTVPDNLLNHFIRGYLDGDGCICNTEENRPRIDFTGTQSFLSSLRTHLENKLNISLNKVSDPTENGITCSLQIGSHNEVKMVLDYLYDDASVFMERKNKKRIEALNLLENKKTVKNYGSDFIPSINGFKIKSKYLESLSAEEKNKISFELFNFYRDGGFPYPTMENDEIIKEFTSLKNKDILTVCSGKILNINNPVGSNIVKYFSPHIFQVKRGDVANFSLLEGFLDDEILKKTIKNRVDQNFNIHGDMIRQGLANSKNAIKASMFNCLIAKYFYETYSFDGDIVYDYSVGFGQRLLGCLSSSKNVKYIGVDPYQKSVLSAKNIFNFLKTNLPSMNKEAEIILSGSENFREETLKEKVSLAFSSPPYYNLELYENTSAQAYSNGYSSFINEYWKKTISNIHYMLKSDGIFILNIKDQFDGFNLSEDMLFTAYKDGFKLIDTYNIQLSRNPTFNNKTSELKFEPIYILQKI